MRGRYRGISVLTGGAVELRLSGGRISSLEPLPDDPALPFLSPGFFDIQVNGYSGVDYSFGELSIEGVEETVKGLAASGTTHHIVTIVTSPADSVTERLEFFRSAAEESPLIRKAIRGIHLEGPFISPEDGPRGAHMAEHVRGPDIGLFNEWQRASSGRVRMITLAPELEGAVGFIREISASGVLCAIGHTAAGPEAIAAAADAGARLSTHLGNGSHALLPRHGNYIWEQAGEDRLCASIICDGYHLPASAVKVLSRVKGKEKLILISDSTGLSGCPPGHYPWGDSSVEIRPDGSLVLSGTPYLAGAGFLLDRDIPRFMEYTGSSLADAVECCNDTPSRLLGFEKNSIETGAPANFTLFKYTPGDTELRVEKTVLEGDELFSA
jgi:N-acetylglucosamine-6-phosphate deacetylase